MKDKTLLLKKRGFILIATYLVVTAISIFALAYFTRSNIFIQASERNYNKIVAFNMAESGVSYAIKKLSTNPSFAGNAATYISRDTATVKGGFTVAISSPTTTTRKIEVVGYAPNNNPTSRAYQTIPIVAYGKYSPGSLFDFAIFAKDSITLTGVDRVANVDSYDSRTAPYDPDNSGSNGDIGTNSSDENAIVLNGTTIVNGDASVGPEGDPDTGIDIGRNATITGVKTTLEVPQVYSTPSTTLPSSGDLTINNTTQTLLAGTYHYDSIKISGGNGLLNLSGQVILYVSGGVDIGGQGVATSADTPTNLIIYVTGSETVKVAGNGSFFGGIFAPNSLVKNDGNAGLFGAVVAKDYAQTGNASIHFDEAMREIEGDVSLGELEIQAWQEQNSVTWGT